MGRLLLSLEFLLDHLILVSSHLELIDEAFDLHRVVVFVGNFEQLTALLILNAFVRHYLLL